MKLSIIVPVYNLENYIARTLDSLLSIQFSHKYEVVIVNDGSTDKSEEIIKKYQQDNKCIRLFTIANNGVSNARNVGIRQATGEYITFIDGDDTVDTNFYEIAVRELEEGRYNFVQGNFKIINDGKEIYNQYVNEDMILNEREDIFDKFFHPGQKLIYNTVWGKVYRAKSIQNLSFDKSLKVAEDQKYIFDLIRDVEKIKLLKADGINYFLRDSSAMHTFNKSKIYDQLVVLSYCKEKNSYKNINNYIEWHELHTMISLYYQLIAIKDSDSEKIYKKIVNIDLKALKPYLDNKTCIIMFFLNHIRIIYDVYIHYKERR